MKQIVKPNEVRVGNYIYDDFDEIHIVEKIESQKYNDWNGSAPELIIFSKLKDIYHGMYGCEIVSGIPLTPELLEKAGFKDISGDQVYAKMNLGHITFAWHIRLKTIEWASVDDVSITHITTVHQLQNLYHALTGEELKIEL